MDSTLPSMSSSPTRPPAYVRNLARCPREIVHQILSDLPIIKVLQILSHKIQHLTDCVLTHIHYQRFFRQPSDRSRIVDHFILYRDVCRFTNLPLSDKWSLMSKNYSMDSEPPTLNDIYLCLLETITRILSISQLDQDLLQAHSYTPYPVFVSTNLQNLWARWNWIKDAKFEQNASKSRQLNMAADLIAKYPGKLILKKPLDPSQDGPRLNAGHVANRLRGDAKRVLRNRNICNRWHGNCYPGIDFIELVPYDRFLWFFLDNLETYPLDDPEFEAGQQFQKLSIASALTDTTASDEESTTKFQYPEDIALSIKVVMDGLMYVYTHSRLVVPRIRWRKSRDPNTGELSTEEMPLFCNDNGRHSPHLPANIHRCVAKRVIPYDEREYKWLKAFLKVVTWMEDNFGSSDKVDGVSA